MYIPGPLNLPEYPSPVCGTQICTLTSENGEWWNETAYENHLSPCDGSAPGPRSPHASWSRWISWVIRWTAETSAVTHAWRCWWTSLTLEVRLCYATRKQLLTLSTRCDTASYSTASSYTDVRHPSMTTYPGQNTSQESWVKWQCITGHIHTDYGQFIDTNYHKSHMQAWERHANYTHILFDVLTRSILVMPPVFCLVFLCTQMPEE